jgi:sodium/potassium-transporting ATPase subunit alpha
MESRNVALQGTLCTNGSGYGVCVGLGSNTVFGQIAKESTGNRPTRTALEVEILRFVLTIASLAGTVVILVVGMHNSF